MHGNRKLVHCRLFDVCTSSHLLYNDESVILQEQREGAGAKQIKICRLLGKYKLTIQMRNLRSITEARVQVSEVSSKKMRKLEKMKVHVRNSFC